MIVGEGLDITYIEGRVKWPLGEEAIRLLVDGGNLHCAPRKRLGGIGLKPLREHEFTLADGTVVKRKVSECYIPLPQEEAHTPVVLG